jgi:hypothetical protein
MAERSREELEKQIAAVRAAVRDWLKLSQQPEHGGVTAAVFRACARDIEEALR